VLPRSEGQVQEGNLPVALVKVIEKTAEGLLVEPPAASVLGYMPMGDPVPVADFSHTAMVDPPVPQTMTVPHMPGVAPSIKQHRPIPFEQQQHGTYQCARCRWGTPRWASDKKKKKGRDLQIK